MWYMYVYDIWKQQKRDSSRAYVQDTKRFCLDMNFYIGFVIKSGESQLDSHSKAAQKCTKATEKKTLFWFVCESGTV